MCLYTTLSLRKDAVYYYIYKRIHNMDISYVVYRERNYL